MQLWDVIGALYVRTFIAIGDSSCVSRSLFSCQSFPNQPE